MFDVASLPPELSATNGAVTIEGSGVGLGHEIANGSAGKRWKLRVDAVGLWSSAEQVKACHKYDHNLKGFITMEDITKPVATDPAAAHLLGPDGIREAELTQIAAQNNGRISYEDFLKTVGLSENAGFARAKWEVEPAVRSAGGCVSIALVPDPAEPFRNEVLVSRRGDSATKMRGIGYSWRSDGSLISQELKSSGEPVTWTGRSSTYSVGDEVEVEVDPMGLTVRLFVNGQQKSSFPTIPCRGYRLGVQLNRARVTLLSVQDLSHAGASKGVAGPGLKAHLRKPLEQKGIEKLSPLLGEETPEVNRLGLRAVFREPRGPSNLPHETQHPDQAQISPEFIAPKKIALTEHSHFQGRLEARVAENRARRVCKTA
jgi:hypothetical protein